MNFWAHTYIGHHRVAWSKGKGDVRIKGFYVGGNSSERKIDFQLVIGSFTHMHHGWEAALGYMNLKFLNSSK